MSDKQYVIGIDVGGTNMRAVLFDGKKVLAEYKLATPKDNLEHFLVMMKALVEPLEERAKSDRIKIKGVGLSIAGILDSKKRTMLYSPNIEIINSVKVADLLEERIERPVYMENDASCLIRGEVNFGAAEKYENVYGIIIGTGIGGGWWYNGGIYDGAHGGAGEPGETIVDFGSRLNVEQMYHKLTQNNPSDLAEKAYRGDELALKTFQELGELIGIMLANITNTINPEAFVLGGGVVESSDLFLPQAKKTMKKYIDSSEASKKVKVLKGKLGDNAGAIGAALLFEGE